MKQTYYSFPKEELLKNPKISLILMEDNQEVFKSIAEEMIAEIEHKNSRNDKTVFIVPVGPVGQYSYFVNMVNERKLSLKNVWFINMDEYLDDKKQWIDMSDKLSFRGFMEREVYSQINQELVMPNEQRIFPDPNNISFIPQLIEELGGVDIAIGGIGINGHIAFNEPQDQLTGEEFLQLKTRVLEIAQETRAVNSVGDLNGAIDEMPRYCVTIGIYEISNARKIRLGCFRDWHRAVVRHAAYGIKSAQFPVTLLQDHPNINIKFTQFVANL
ncbi:MAG: sugar phosphate isomerase family [Mobilitalea sp.]